MFKAVFIYLLVLSTHCFSQFAKLSRYEKRWAVFHPFAALKVNKITPCCYTVYNQANIKLQLDSFSNGGKLDAFRHTFFMAAYAQKIKPKKIKKLGVAHEKENYRQFLKAQKEDGETPDSLSSVMDLKNNAVGIAIGRLHKKINLDELKQLVITEIKNGNAFVIKRNKRGQYVDCNGSVIDLALYIKTWYVPKCLVSSD